MNHSAHGQHLWLEIQHCHQGLLCWSFRRHYHLNSAGYPPHFPMRGGHPDYGPDGCGSDGGQHLLPLHSLYHRSCMGPPGVHHRYHLLASTLCCSLLFGIAEFHSRVHGHRLLSFGWFPNNRRSALNSHACHRLGVVCGGDHCRLITHPSQNLLSMVVPDWRSGRGFAHDRCCSPFVS